MAVNNHPRFSEIAAEGLVVGIGESVSTFAPTGLLGSISSLKNVTVGSIPRIPVVLVSPVPRCTISIYIPSTQLPACGGYPPVLTVADGLGCGVAPR